VDGDGGEQLDGDWLFARLDGDGAFRVGLGRSAVDEDAVEGEHHGIDNPESEGVLVGWSE
jgi:hypothetical protein